ncbi:protein SODIUM POTASSIUM ROOT DEFECTIVE 3-like [Phalaenopsis equestris]|uniref:protein SODIUM POTASSIUM ROOT DEFECTIVE 3-like n=1 Tax=Phalaenopsis equestris TaxID=78828 RepID=UPI0009E31787|nr:protein SODIUM POTASSIUM ROOT DEFECTIVE 3-like [Phalaenopsis equestris]
MASNLSSSFHDISSSSTSSSSLMSHGRAIDRYSPHLRDPLREKYLPRLHSRAKPCNQKSRKSKEKSPQITSPATSSRYLLNDVSVAIDDISEAEILPPMISVDEYRLEYSKGDDFIVVESLSSESSPVRQSEQVVVLKVSLHCKGCEGKVRKHISKMKGVTSFTTDLATNYH